VSSLHVAVLQVFKARAWAYQSVQGMEVIESGFEAHHAKVPLHVQSFGETGILSVVSEASFDVPRSHYPAVSELLMRTNQMLNLGNFELGWDTGKVHYRVTNVFPPRRPDEEIIAMLVENAVAEMDRLTPQLAEVCRTPKGELLLLNIAEVMKRVDFPET
jgi:hypothetical protein